MNNGAASQFERLLDSFTRNLEATADELVRFRAWETILYLFFVRYYLERKDSVSLALGDRSFLADTLRTHGGDEQTAQQVEAIYENIVPMIENYLASKNKPQRPKLTIVRPQNDRPKTGGK
jgi:hypothetical protein